MTIIYTDRYQALGMVYPNQRYMCHGQCEGTGVIPVKADETDERLIALWRESEQRDPASDGWHFVTCPTCQGTGKSGVCADDGRV